jgi:uncharacterized SAM-binding protein YcdF (DUF218 family)
MIADPPVARADAIVVLGCKVLPDGSPSPALGRRLELALRAYRAEVAPLVVLTGGRRWDGHAEAVAMQRSLRRAGVPDEALRLELCSLTTHENGVFCRSFLAEQGLRSAFLATCAWHLPRAARSFRRQGIEVVLPPPGWLGPVPVSPWLRLRESVSSWADWCMMAARLGS